MNKYTDINTIESAKKAIMNAAWKRFPAQELWIHNDLRFWAYEVGNKEISITEGLYTGDDIKFETKKVKVIFKMDDYIEDIIKEKLEQNYECFASQLFGN